MANLIGNPLEHTVAIASVIFGGLMDRYPNLKMCFAHGGGYACYGAPRLNRGHLVRSESCINIDKLPGDYLSSLYYDCLTRGYDELEFLINRVGSGRVLLGNDFSFDMGLDSPAEWVRNLVGIGEDEKELFLEGML